MQPQMNSAPMPQPDPGPSLAPPPGVTGPAVVRPRRPKPGGVKFTLSAILAIVVVAGLGFYVRSAMRPAEKGGKGGGGAAVRTAPVLAGDLNQTIRLSGTIQAERFAAILAPRMHGSRSGRGRSSGSLTSNVAMPSFSSASSGGGSGSSSDTSSVTSSSAPMAVTSSDSSTDSGGDVASRGSGGARGGGGMRGSSSGGGSAGGRGGASSGSTGGGSQGGGTRSSGGGGGSTGGGGSSGGGGSPRGGGGGGAAGGGGMGGGMNEFSLVLLSVAKPGSTVKKGDVIAEFDRQYMILRLDDYRASGVQMDNSIAKLKADLTVAEDAAGQMVRVAKADLDKALLDLKTIPVRSEIEAERFKLSVEQAQARYKQALDDVKLYEESWRSQLRAVEIDRDQARMELQRAEANVDRMILKAPIDGIVVMQTMYRSGEAVQIQAGDQVFSGMFFMSIVDTSSMVMNATVNQADSEMLRLNQKARIRLDAYPDVDIPGSLIGIGAMTQQGGWRASYVRQIPVRLKLLGQDTRIIPDLSASADVVLASEQQAVIAPRAAVFRDSAAQQPFVWLQGPQGWVRREVELGLESNIAVAVRSGLRKGDVVAVEKPRS